MPEELVGLDAGEPGLVDHLGVVQALHLRVEEVKTFSILPSTWRGEHFVCSSRATLQCRLRRGEHFDRTIFNVPCWQRMCEVSCPSSG